MSFAPIRLKLARERLGITKTEVADKTGISTRMLGYYEDENSHREPTSEQRSLLSEALNIPESFFMRPELDPVEQDAVSFRKLSRTKASTKNAVLASAALVVEMFQALEQKYLLPQADLPTLDNLKPEDAAITMRQQWGLGDKPISNMLHLVESKGIRVAAINYDEDVDAFCFVRDQTPYVMLNTTKSAARRRFDLAHELGHLVLHSEQNLTPSDSKKREQEANHFAAAFLMPKSAVLNQSMGSATIERVLKAKKYWNVSALAMAHRLSELNLVTAWQYRSLYLNLREMGYARAEPGDMPAETSILFRKTLLSRESSSTYSARELANDLSQPVSEVYSYVRNLIPLMVQADAS